MRASSYVIYVDLPHVSDEMLLVHGYSGAYDKVSKRVAAFIRSLEIRRPPRPLYGAWASEPTANGPVEPPSEATLEALKRRGYLTEMSLEKEEEVFNLIARKLHEVHSRRPSYIFIPTYDCNLRCAYCFQDHMRTDGRFHHLLSKMTLETADRIFKGITNIEAAHGLAPARKPEAGQPDAAQNDVAQPEARPVPRSFGFFGGEPLLAANHELVGHIIGRAMDLGPAVFWAVSNATELSAYEDLLSPQKLSSIQITLDGPPAEHDQRRIYESGSGSFENIARNISLALDRGVNINVRINVDRSNISQLPELAEVVHERGWAGYRNFSVYVAPIRSVGNGVTRSQAMSSWEIDCTVAEMRNTYPLMAIMAQPDDALKRQAYRIFEDPEHHIPNLRESFCGAHTSMYIFDAFGDIYACWERTGEPSLRVGHILEDGNLQMNLPLLREWRSRTVMSNPVCGKCRYALHCGGGCAVLAHNSTGELHRNFCDGFSSRFRANIAEAYIAHISGQTLAGRADRLCDQ